MTTAEQTTQQVDCDTDVCPVLHVFVRDWNVDLDRDARELLTAPLRSRLPGTAKPEATRRRSLMSLDWFLRAFVPAWLEVVPSTAGHAAALRKSSPVVCIASASAIGSAVRETRDAARLARTAAWSGVATGIRDTHRESALTALRAAGHAAAWRGALVAAEDALEAANWSLAWSSCWTSAITASAAGIDLTPTVEKVRASAIDLFDGMASV